MGDGIFGNINPMVIDYDRNINIQETKQHSTSVTKLTKYLKEPIQIKLLGCKII